MENLGMPRFDTVLTAKDSAEIKAYVLHQAMDRWDVEQTNPRWLAIQRWLADKLAIVLVWLSG